MRDTIDQIVSHEEIEKRAYEIYLRRGGGDGRDLDDWFAAEQDARERFFGEIIELRPTATLAIFRDHGREIGSFLRKDEQLGMTV